MQLDLIKEIKGAYFKCQVVYRLKCRWPDFAVEGSQSTPIPSTFKWWLRTLGYPTFSKWANDRRFPVI